MFRHARDRARGERGASAVEFALVTVPLLLIVFGIIQYGMYFYAAQTGTSVTREALRRVSVGDCPQPYDVTSFVQNRLGSVNAGGLSVTRTFKDSAGAVSSTPVVGASVSLHVEFKVVNMHFPFLPFPANPKVVRDVDARMEDNQPENACT